MSCIQFVSQIVWLARNELVPMWLWYSCCRQTNYMQNTNGLKAYFSKYLAYAYKMRINSLFLKRLLLDTGFFNKKSRTPVFWLLISFVMSWTQSVIKHNAEIKQLHTLHLTQGSIAHCYFCEGGQARFHSTYSWWGSYQALVVASQWIRPRHAVIAILEPHEHHELRSGLAGNGLYHWDKAFVQRAPLYSAKCTYTEGRPGDLLYNGALQPLHGKSSPNSEQTRSLCLQVDIYWQL